ncbi:hypothetical protein NQ317_016189 [Molorchus minor]|uniref:C2H2-type domain-containing protein n=1 Tax=Molorchus minor TaxID=1323400 RepID=A0ABQ9IZK2_9CUCU|nr:hypothetical protein NQ317_016189 [Molorchus minor]
MYSEWRQQDTKTDKLYVGNYDFGGRRASGIRYKCLRLHRVNRKKGDEQKSNTIPGGYECNDDYTYIRGRGRGRYVCDQCGIRCKKPSMLKKHIRTHSNERPYTCSHCNFSFKTKGNLTKHMKSKAHTKNYTASGGSGSSTQQSATQSSESDTEDSGMDSSDESTRQQEHEAAYGLLSLSQKPTQTSSPPCQAPRSSSPVSNNELFMSTEEIAYVSKTNYAKNKILDERNSLSFTTTRRMDLAVVTTIEESTEMQNVTNYLGKSNITRPLTYPYTSMISNEDDIAVNTLEVSTKISKNNDFVLNHMEPSSEPKSIKQFHVIQKYAPPSAQQIVSPKVLGSPSKMSPPPKKIENMYNSPERALTNNVKNLTLNPSRVLPTLKVNDIVIHENLNDLRKRKIPVIQNLYKSKIQRNDEVMDLSMPTSVENQEKPPRLNGSTDEHHFNNTRPVEHGSNVASEVYTPRSPQGFDVNVNEDEDLPYSKGDITYKNPEATIANNLVGSMPNENPVNINFEHPANVEDHLQYVQDYDNSAMETLADIATQREKLDKNTLAKNVASETRKGCRDMVQGYGPINKDVNDIIVKSEGSKSCSICSKSFNKPSQLRLHMNIHYLERPFRCDSCSVSFRTKGHLQKHERSASHHNKLSSSPALSSLEPRPFKCSDCNIAFRIHGHLAKHLRSKMHIMKLECLAKIPFGLYAELERSNSLLTEINTCDGDQCLESLKTLAMKVFINDPNKLDQLELREKFVDYLSF